MTALTPWRRTGRRLTRLCARAALALCGAFIVLLPAVGRAQQGASAGEELYVERLGCWGCHGRVGEGGEGRPLRNTQLPLSRFVKELRLPGGIMPPFASFIVSDAELALVYDWLEGVDTVETPPPVTFTLEGFEEVTADTEAVVAFTARATDGGTAGGNAAMRFRYRLTLLRRDNTPVAGRTLHHQGPGHDGWSAFTTNEHGQAVLGPEEGVALADLPPDEGATTRLRMALPAGRYAFVVEAVEATAPASPLVVGVGAAVVNVE